MPYIHVLAQSPQVSAVSVIVPAVALSERRLLGWSDDVQQYTGQLEIVIAPTSQDVHSLLKKAIQTGRTYCFFSGISAFADVSRWLRISLDYPVIRSVITEPPFTYRKPLWLHRIRFVLQDWKLARHIDYVFAIGKDCETYYRSWKLPWQVVPFMYCTEPIACESVRQVNLFLSQDVASVHICFVGSLEIRKHVDLLLQALVKLRDADLSILSSVRLTIVGDGPERNSLEKMCREHQLSKIVHFTGSVLMEDISGIFSHQDIMVLPSKYDGWGAVVNEAMTLGVVPVCSDRCGARKIVKMAQHAGLLGEVFPHDDAKTLALILEKLVQNIRSIRTQRNRLMEWARNNISPECVAQIMLKALR